MVPTRTEVSGAEIEERSLDAHGPAIEDCSDANVMSPAADAQRICLRLLTARPRSRAELADALRRRGIPEQVGEPVLDRLRELGLVDDAAFAESTVQSGHRHRGLGRRALSTELRRRGVPSEIADQALVRIGPEDEERRARELVRRKLRTSTVRDASTLVRKLGGMLARRGYSEGLAWRVVCDELGPGDWTTEGEPTAD